MLEEKQKLIISIFVVVLVLAGFGVGIYLGLKERAGLVGKIKELRRIIADYNQKIAQIETLTEKIVALQDEISRYEVIIPDSEELDKMADTVEELRKKSGVAIKDFRKVTRTLTPKERGKAYRRVSYKIKLLGNFFDFVTFINLLENHERFIRVDSFTVNPKDEESLLKDIELLISTFTYEVREAKAPTGASP